MRCVRCKGPRPNEQYEFCSSYCRLMMQIESLSDDNKELRDALGCGIKMLKHYGPPHPEHTCGPESNCDTICMEYDDFQKELRRIEFVKF